MEGFANTEEGGLMKLLEAGRKKKRIGYLIRRDLKQSWIDEQIKNNSVIFYNNGPEYIHPTLTPVIPPESVGLGWEHLSDAQMALAYHLDNASIHGFNSEEKWNYKVVKVTVIEEETCHRR